MRRVLFSMRSSQAESAGVFEEDEPEHSGGVSGCFQTGIGARGAAHLPEAGFDRL